MMIFVAPLTALIGLLVYVLAANPKAAELGRILFAVGALATLLLLDGTHAVHLP